MGTHIVPAATERDSSYTQAVLPLLYMVWSQVTHVVFVVQIKVPGTQGRYVVKSPVAYPSVTSGLAEDKALVPALVPALAALEAASVAAVTELLVAVEMMRIVEEPPSEKPTTVDTVEPVKDEIKDVKDWLTSA